MHGGEKRGLGTHLGAKITRDLATHCNCDGGVEQQPARHLVSRLQIGTEGRSSLCLTWELKEEQCGGRECLS